jgi:hypothetical protein
MQRLLLALYYAYNRDTFAWRKLSSLVFRPWPGGATCTDDLVFTVVVYRTFTIVTSSAIDASSSSVYCTNVDNRTTMFGLLTSRYFYLALSVGVKHFSNACFLLTRCHSVLLTPFHTYQFCVHTLSVGVITLLQCSTRGQDSPVPVFHNQLLSVKH